MTFVFGNKSKANLSGVHRDLKVVTVRALEIVTTDFMVFEGVRSIDRQRELVAAGASRMSTLEPDTLGRHISGHAVDLVPYVSGEVRWDWPLCYLIAAAMREASIELETPVRWGGVWDRTMDNLSDDLMKDVGDYVTRFKKRRGRAPLMDGPHYELPRSEYPTRD